jgi:hypothetical protein
MRAGKVLLTRAHAKNSKITQFLFFIIASSSLFYYFDQKKTEEE